MRIATTLGEDSVIRYSDPPSSAPGVPRPPRCSTKHHLRQHGAAAVDVYLPKSQLEKRKAEDEARRKTAPAARHSAQSGAQAWWSRPRWRGTRCRPPLPRFHSSGRSLPPWLSLRHGAAASTRGPSRRCGSRPPSRTPGTRTRRSCAAEGLRGCPARGRH